MKSNILSELGLIFGFCFIIAGLIRLGIGEYILINTLLIFGIGILLIFAFLVEFK